MRKEIKGLDGVRALAVISVVLTHINFFGALSEKGYFPAQAIPLVSGGTGVQAFFVLSGFLITRLLIEEFKETSRISIRNFVIRRTLRIFPLYIFFLIVITIFHVSGSNITTWESLTYAYAYVYNFVPSDVYTPILGHTWSLAVEEHFYLVWPALFFFLVKEHRAALVSILVLLIAAAPAVHIILIKLGVGDNYFVERWTFVAGSAIASGCLLAILLDIHTFAERLRKIASKRFFLAIGVLFYANSTYLLVDSWIVANIVHPHLRMIGITFLLAWLYTNQASTVTAVLEIKPLKYVGIISYGVYMYQGLFLSTGPDRAPDSTWPPSPEVGLILLAITAPLSYRFIEKPFLRLKSQFSESNTHRSF